MAGMDWQCTDWPGSDERGAVMQARQNDNGDRPVAARKDGLHLNNAERHNKLIGE